MLTESDLVYTHQVRAILDSNKQQIKYESCKTDHGLPTHQCRLDNFRATKHMFITQSVRLHRVTFTFLHRSGQGKSYPSQQQANKKRIHSKHSRVYPAYLTRGFQRALICKCPAYSTFRKVLKIKR